tara:strand:+ start:821 stop:1147 length:327 start_codon:yes stop_codon:yes gene_type:complete
MAKYKHNINGVEVDFTAEEEAIKDAEAKAWNDAKADRKLTEIKRIRLQKLMETDYLANSDVTMPDNVKTWRQTLRDIPANHSDEAAYDALLARDEETGNLTNSIWSKP